MVTGWWREELSGCGVLEWCSRLLSLTLTLLTLLLSVVKSEIVSLLCSVSLPVPAPSQRLRLCFVVSQSASPRLAEQSQSQLERREISSSQTDILSLHIGYFGPYGRPVTQSFTINNLENNSLFHHFKKSHLSLSLYLSIFIIYVYMFSDYDNNRHHQGGFPNF